MKLATWCGILLSTYMREEGLKLQLRNQNVSSILVTVCGGAKHEAGDGVKVGNYGAEK